MMVSVLKNFPSILTRNGFFKNIQTKPFSTQVEAVIGTYAGKGIKTNIENIQAREKFMKEEEHNFEIGRRHLANIMGENVEFFTQNDIDRSIEYLFPSGLFDKKARPSMKPPKEVYAKVKEVQFDLQGRPYHSLFYTIMPRYYEEFHKISLKVQNLNKMMNIHYLTKSKPKDQTELSLIGTRWLTLTELSNMHDEKYVDFHHENFIKLFDKLVEHPLAYKEKDYIASYRRPIKFVRTEDIPQPMLTPEGRPYMTHTTRYRTSIADVVVYGNGTGKIKINGKDLLYFKNIQEREEIVFPLMFSELWESVDVEITVVNGGSCSQAHASRHALSMCLASFVESNMQLKMKISGLLQIDLRNRERKKFGQEGARRKYTWKKR